MAEVDFLPVDTKIDFRHEGDKVTPSCVCAARHLKWASTPEQHFRDFVERACPYSISMARFMSEGKKKMSEGGRKSKRKKGDSKMKSAPPQGASRTQRQRQRQR